MTKRGVSVAPAGPTNGRIQNTWICRGCGGAKHEIWCWDCDIHKSGQTLSELREEKSVHDLDNALSASLDYSKVPTS